MNEPKRDDPSEPVAEAEVVQRSRPSIVWLIPAVALLLGGWLLFKSIRDRGVSIVVTFETADGLEAGKTAIRYRDVQVGLVNSISVAPTRDHVEVAIVIDRTAEDMVVEDARFWVVRPRATLQGISGLGTLLSGAYIAIEPGEGPLDEDRRYTGLEQPPQLARDALGARYVLTAETLGSVTVGSPVFFRGFDVGEILSYELDRDNLGVTMEIFVRDPHHELVLRTSRFWNASGIDVTAGADGLRIDMASLESLLIGGIEFDSPVTPGRASARAAPGAAFKLYRSRADIAVDKPGGVHLVCFFEDSLRGLDVGAPVEYSGISIGHVEAIDICRDPAGNVHLPVTIAVFPELMALPEDALDDDPRARLAAAVDRGLRAKLSSGSLLTGALFVELVYDATTPARLGQGYGSSLPEVPTVASGLAAIEASLSRAITKLDSILTKVDGLPLNELVQNAADAAASIDRLAASPDLEEAIRSAGRALDEVEPTLAELRGVLRDVDDGVRTVVDEMQATTRTLRGTLEQAERTLAGVDASVGPDSTTHVELRRALREASLAARSLRELASYLERHPEALLQGKSGDGGR